MTTGGIRGVLCRHAPDQEAADRLKGEPAHRRRRAARIPGNGVAPRRPVPALDRHVNALAVRRDALQPIQRIDAGPKTAQRRARIERSSRPHHRETFTGLTVAVAVHARIRINETAADRDVIARPRSGGEPDLQRAMGRGAGVHRRRRLHARKHHHLIRATRDESGGPPVLVACRGRFRDGPQQDIGDIRPAPSLPSDGEIRRRRIIDDERKPVDRDGVEVQRAIACARITHGAGDAIIRSHAAGIRVAAAIGRDRAHRSPRTRTRRKPDPASRIDGPGEGVRCALDAVPSEPKRLWLEGQPGNGIGRGGRISGEPLEHAMCEFERHAIRRILASRAPMPVCCSRCSGPRPE